MQQVQDNEPVQASDASLELKRRLIARANEASAAGQVGRLLRDTHNLVAVETDFVQLAATDDWLKRYGWPAAAALMADFRPQKSIWSEIVVGDDRGSRIGCLCLGHGSGTLKFYGAYCEPGPAVAAKGAVVIRTETTWKSGVDWNAVASGTWSPGKTWLRRANSWLKNHFRCHLSAPSAADGFDDRDDMIWISLVMVLSQSPSLNPAPVAEAA